MITPELLAPLGVQVLGPDEQDLPEKGGLLKWLSSRPLGYLRIEEPVPISTDGTQATFWVTVAAVAPTRAAAQALSDAAHPLIAGRPWEPTQHRMVVPDLARQTSSGIFVCRPSYEAPYIDGQPV